MKFLDIHNGQEIYLILQITDKNNEPKALNMKAHVVLYEPVWGDLLCQTDDHETADQYLEFMNSFGIENLMSELEPIGDIKRIHVELIDTHDDSLLCVHHDMQDWTDKLMRADEIDRLVLEYEERLKDAKTSDLIAVNSIRVIKRIKKAWGYDLFSQLKAY